MVKKVFSAVSVFMCCLIGCLTADDLTLKNGMVLKNYRIKEVKNDQVMILFNRHDGSPDMVNVPVSSLPDNMQQQYQKKQPPPQPPKKRKAKTLRGEWINAAEQLQYDLVRLPAKNAAQRTALLNRVRYQVQSRVAALAETADFQLLSSDKSGALLKVVGTYKGAKLNSGQVIYLYGYNAAQRIFKQKIFPSGVFLNYGNHGATGIYGVNAAAAGQVALGFISRYLGDNTLFLPPVAEKKPEKQQPIVPSVINNIYYIDDDDDDDWHWEDRYYISRPRPRPHPDKPVRPDKPDRPDRPDRPDKPQPEKKPWKPSTPSIVSKTEGSTISRGLLPDWDNPRIKYAPKKSETSGK